MSSKQGRLSDQETARLRAGDLIERGFSNEEIMEILEVSLSSAKRWRRKVNENGIQELYRETGSGKPSSLTHEQLEELKNIIVQGAHASGYLTDRWTSRLVADLIRKKWDVDYSGSNVRRILNELGFSYHKPSVKSTKHSQEIVDHWRKHDWNRIKKRQTKKV
jgi:transposase